ncbi:hypothetical protein Leryth_023524 [Lithospermum erythrorhizon]|nr:hypothetical protein Leryth_023524 [Lithospermum erythrorhizon]
MGDASKSYTNYAGTQIRKVTIQNKHDEKLVGIFHDTGSKELVIICHGFKSSKDRIPMVNLATSFDNEGISAFRFDFSGNGESEGVFQYGNYYREADDLHCVVQHFHGKGRLVIALIGHSKGGNAVLLYASRHRDVHNVVNIAGRFNLQRGMEGRLGKDFLQKMEQQGFIDVKNRRGRIDYRVTKDDLMDRLTTNMHAACHSIHESCRVLTVHGSKDEMVTVEDAMQFAKCISNHKLHITEGADHEYTLHQDELISIVLDFVKGVTEDKPEFLSSGKEANKIHSRF